MKRLQYIAPFVILIGAIFFVSQRTSGFKAFTTYSYELSEAQPFGKSFPDSLMIHVADKAPLPLSQQTKGHYTLVSLVFLKCPMVCPIITARLHGLYTELDSLNAQRTDSILTNLQFMTLSFDGVRDKLSDLNNYKSAVLGKSGAVAASPNGSDRIWDFAVINSTNYPFIERQLSEIGFWIYQPYEGMFNHSPYLYLINPEGKIKNIYDPGKMTDEMLISALKQDVGRS